jgi:hypothetical protein
MNTQPQAQHLQLNLLLANAPPAEIPANRNEALVLALAELLVSAAKGSPVPNAATGGQSESEADR